MRFTKLIAAVIGVPLVLGGLALTVFGGIALAVPDDDGWISAGPLRVSSEAVAVVGDDIRIDLGNHVGNGGTFVGWDGIPARLEANSRNGKDVFIGVASAPDVATYLAGASVARIESFHHEPEFEERIGAVAVAPPADQGFWVARSVDGSLDWDVTDGEWAVVMLNSDGTAGVDVSVTGAARIPYLGVIGVVAIALGLIAIVFGSLLTYYGVRSVRTPSPIPPQPAQPAVTA
ncbi:MAG: hypothetical protein QNJ89_09010 [Acidimicrobiia bacterium]|nr:hypothetical protein [Acidimicrobiia bacterium]